jgi:hypothetical protein
MRRLPLGLALVAIIALFCAPTSRADQMGWHSEAPIGALGVPAPVGRIGDIAFFAPNRGVLITNGIEGVSPPGVYAYDGVSWHLYSTVCGGEEGRIAWSGPDEFWTVSTYASPQDGSRGPQEEYARTLCRFREGAVVESFAEPFGEPSAYQQMKAAACDGPADCWFAGVPLPGSSPNRGPFHLHWDGSALTAVPSLVDSQPAIVDPPGTITDLDFLGGALFEASEEAPFLRRVDLSTSEVFAPVSLPEGVHGPFALGGDPGQLWAINRNGTAALREIGSGFEAIPLSRRHLLRNKAEEEKIEREEEEGTKVDESFPEVKAVASEPNGAAAWVGGVEANAVGQVVARVQQVSASGAISDLVELPGPGEELDGKGGVTNIVCPGPGQCWMTTEDGWLFHLGGSLPQDTDPAMHALITVRPADASTRSLVPAGLPPDDSGEREAAKVPIGEALEKFPTSHPRKAIVYDVHQVLVGKRTLRLTFKLRATAHVQLKARYHGKIVAKTPRLTLKKGPHRLQLKLDPKRWPTGIDFKVHPVKGRRK